MFLEFKNMNKLIVLLLFVAMLLTLNGSGQGTTGSQNVQDYTPSVLINKGQTEFKLFNSLYTQTQYFNEEGSKLDAGGRSTFFTTIAEYNYGLSSNVSLGGELWFRSVYAGSSESSITNVLGFTNSSKSRTGVNLAGMKIKWNPVKKWKRFSLQTGLLFSVISDPQSEELDRPFLDNNRHLWITKFLYDKKVSEKFQVFIQVSSWMSIDKNLEGENTNLAVPVDLFLSYFPSKKITIYLQNQLWLTIGDDGLSSYFLQEGLGLKFQLFKGVELETSYTSFVIGESAGAGQTYNFGVRILH